MSTHSLEVERYFGNRYLDCSNMITTGTWAIEAEILATAAFLQTDIQIYCKYGKLMRWVRYSSETLGTFKCTDMCIFLTNESGVHFNYVEDIAEF
jgi:hypothetical protein